MKKPENYDEIDAKSFIPVKLGGHYLTVHRVEETKSSTGKDMLVVYFDTAPNDSQPGYFKAEYTADQRPDKKWPARGRFHIVADENGEWGRNLKNFVDCVKASNPGFAVAWGEAAGIDWGAQFKGKRVGGVFGGVENEYNGKVSTRHELRWFCEWENVDGQAIPAVKPLRGKRRKPMTTTTSDGFINVPAGVTDDELPFT